MVCHICEKCGKEFNKKSSYINHSINRKKTCIVQNIKVPNSPQKTTKSPDSIKICPQDTPNNKNICYYCNKEFTRKDHMNRHIRDRCKIKKEQDLEKEGIFKKLLNEYEKIKNELQEKEKIIIDLKKNYENLEKSMNNNIINNISHTNNIQINNINLVSHGKEDLSKIDYKVYLDAMKKTGPLLFEKLLEGIHFNPNYPENHNIYLSDFNREKCMIFNNEKWILENYDNIYPNLISKFIEFGYDKEEASKYFFENGKINQTGMNVINNGMKWIKLIDEYATHLEYNENNEDYNLSKIPDGIIEMIEFRKKHKKEDFDKNLKIKLKNYLYNNRERITNSLEKINYSKN